MRISVSSTTTDTPGNHATIHIDRDCVNTIYGLIERSVDRVCSLTAIITSGIKLTHRSPLNVDIYLIRFRVTISTAYQQIRNGGIFLDLNRDLAGNISGSI